MTLALHSFLHWVALRYCGWRAGVVMHRAGRRWNKRNECNWNVSANRSNERMKWQNIPNILVGAWWWLRLRQHDGYALIKMFQHSVYSHSFHGRQLSVWFSTELCEWMRERVRAIFDGNASWWVVWMRKRARAPSTLIQHHCDSVSNCEEEKISSFADA